MKAYRYFQMSVINAIVEVRTYRATSGAVELKECCRLLRVRPGSTATYDYKAIEYLEPIWEQFEGPMLPREHTIRHILKVLIINERPQWGLLLPQGRRIVKFNATPDVKQCLEYAGCFKEIPDSDNITWWDELAGLFRDPWALGRVSLGRRGELLSMEFERAKLDSQGHIGPEPFWSAIQDETLGYDIQSCQILPEGPQKLYIEVKASERDPFVFFLSDNEWRVAQNFKDSYEFHFWHLPSKRHRVVRVDQVAPHIPMNQGAGTWTRVQIVWPGV